MQRADLRSTTRFEFSPVNPLNVPEPSDMPARHIILDPDSLPVVGQRWNWTITSLLGGLMVFMPAAFGAVEAWSELVVVLGAAALSLCVVARLSFDREFRLARTWLYVPLGLFVILVGLQIVAVPAGILRAVVPWNVATKEQMLGETFDSAQLTTLSFYPHATAEQLRLALAGLAVFVTVASVFRT